MMNNKWPRPVMRDNGHGVSTRIQSERFQVQCPKTELFIVEAHKWGGRWRERSGIWSFPRYRFADVAQALNRIYGTQIKTHIAED